MSWLPSKWQEWAAFISIVQFIVVVIALLYASSFGGIVNLTQEETTVGTQARNHVSSSRQLTIASTQIASSHKPNLDFITVR
jgi:hypothetical protein